MFFFLLPTFISTVHAGPLYVTDTLSTPTITEPVGGVPGFLNSVPDRMHVLPE